MRRNVGLILLRDGRSTEHRVIPRQRSKRSLSGQSGHRPVRMLWTAPAPRHRSAVDWLSQPERFKERQATTVRLNLKESARTDEVMQTRSIRGSGQPAWVNTSLKACFRLRADPRSRSDTDRTRRMLHQLRKLRRRRPHTTQCMVRVAREPWRVGGERSCINVSGLRLERCSWPSWISARMRSH
jgi:hypothetical protein